MGCLYKLTSPSQKSYIGITKKTIDFRWNRHVQNALVAKSPGALYAAIRKYGPDQFTREVLLETGDWLELRRLEKQAIISQRTFPPHGYNISSGAEGADFYVFSDEARRNISEAQKRRYERPEERARLFAAGAAARMVRSRKAALAREAKRAVQIAYLNSPAFKVLHAAATRVGMARPEVRARTLAAQRNKTEAWRRHISESKRGKKVAPCSEQRRQRISEARKREWQDPAMRMKRLIALHKWQDKSGEEHP